MPRSSGLEEHLLCSICLEVFTDPVSTPCDHNFCKSCICKHWDSSRECSCPLCKTIFSVRPYLRVNTLFSEIVSQVKKQAQVLEDPGDPQSKTTEVMCDACSEPKLKALKSCLVCLSSFCESHLQPHLNLPGLKRHQLLEPVNNLEDRMCPTHDRPLELFCCTDKKTICMMCSVLEHKNHDFVPLKEAFEQEKSSLQETVSENQRLVEQRRLKVQEITAELDKTKREAARETQEMIKVFSDIVEAVQTCLDLHTEIIEQTKIKLENRGRALILELQQEMLELEKRNSEAEQLKCSTDWLHFLQRCHTLTSPAGLKDWTDIRFQHATFQGTTARALSSLSCDITKTMRRSVEAELKRARSFATDVTLDPDTAHVRLVLSKDKKKVHHSENKKKSPENKERFSESLSVLGKPLFSSGRAYFEVQVEGKTQWEVGIAKESINRKGQVMLTPSDGFWALRLRNSSEYHALASPHVPLSPQHPLGTLGVFVDHTEGVVSFHNAESSELLYAFSRCNFSEPLMPFLAPGHREGKNSAPLVLVGGPEPDSASQKRHRKVSKTDSETTVCSVESV